MPTFPSGTVTFLRAPAWGTTPGWQRRTRAMLRQVVAGDLQAANRLLAIARRRAASLAVPTLDGVFGPHPA